MRRGIHAIVLSVLCAWGALSAQAVQAFTFPEQNGVVQLVSVPDDTFGEAWAIAQTESWGDTRNTVWSHCEAVLESFGTLTPNGVNTCARDVASINNTSLQALGQLREGDTLILPLLRFDVEAPEQSAVQSEQSTSEISEEGATFSAQGSLGATAVRTVDDVYERMGVQGGIITSTLEEIGVKIDDYNTTLATLSSRMDTLAQELQTLRASGVQTATIQTPIEVTPQTAGVASLETLWNDLRLQWWTPLALAGVFLLLLLYVIILNVRLRTHRHKYADIGRRLREVESYFDFRRRLVDFDGVKYWVELIEINNEGRHFRTQFAERVKEHNLKSHFAHATRATPKVKAAAE